MDSPQNEQDLSKLNARLKNQFAAEFIQMMTEVTESSKPDLFIALGHGSKVLHALFQETWHRHGKVRRGIERKMLFFH